MPVKIVHTNQKPTAEQELKKTLVFDVELLLRRTACLCNKLLEEVENTIDNVNCEQEASNQEIRKHQTLFGRSDSAIDATIKITKIVEKIDTIAKKYQINIIEQYDPNATQEISDEDLMILEQIVKDRGMEGFKELTQININKKDDKSLEIVKEYSIINLNKKNQNINKLTGLINEFHNSA
ncbi:MAG: hypothetical protein RL208_663 [Pseudomonadota bacterium]|jgi:hypothetical protein